ncbi:MAG: response regulator transcription factor [Clostridia bacterium]|nr:response regulator transcription factor [Clostridia bacterium]
MRLLLAEDEKELSKAIVAILKHNNYSVDAVYDGKSALDWAMTGNYDGILLDLMMPEMNGLDVLVSLRARGVDTPVIILTAKSEVDDRIAGLDAGADDYLPKPFAMGELLARVRAITRRKSGFTPNTLSVGNLSLNRESYELLCNGETIRLAGKEYQMIEMLMSNPNNLISVDQFMERIWGYDSDTENSVVWVYISNLRKKLVSMGADVEIKATRNAGYYLETKRGDDK